MYSHQLLAGPMSPYVQAVCVSGHDTPKLRKCMPRPQRTELHPAMAAHFLHTPLSHCCEELSGICRFSEPRGAKRNLLSCGSLSSGGWSLNHRPNATEVKASYRPNCGYHKCLS